jgi:site-specific DNA-methyltransferase (adenine-specific)
MADHVIFNKSNAGLPDVRDESVHLIVTSPPYVTTEFKRGQKFDYEGFLIEFSTLCSDLFRVTVPGGRFALNVADIITKYRYPDDKTISRVPLGSDLLQCALSSGFRLLERYIWDKGYTRNFKGPLLGSYPYPLTIFNNCYFEYIWILQKPGKRHVKQSVRKCSAISKEDWQQWVQRWWRIESLTDKIDFHRAVFPLEIPKRLIAMYSYRDDTVLDPYCGTGATMIAAHVLGRNSIGYEIDPRAKTMVEKRIDLETLPLLEPFDFRFVEG